MPRFWKSLTTSFVTGRLPKRAPLKRLMADGIPEREARELIACVASTEIFDVLKSGQPYQEERYLAGLRALPRLPWENEE